jgi:transcriptional regulator with XRE-family HTH domain
MESATASRRVGPLLREWRERRGRTQLDLALDAGVSTRHLSFVETGRSAPSAEMVLLLAERLDIPLRERNHLLLAAGYAPTFAEHSLNDPSLGRVRQALHTILSGHDPYPAVVVDRNWDLVAANAAMAALTATVDPELLEPPVNVMRVGLHPRGLASSIINLVEVRAYFLGRLQRQVAMSGDEALSALLDEVTDYPAPANEHEPASPVGTTDILTPRIRLRAPDGTELALLATVATFGTAVEITTSELSIELTYPADVASAEALRKLAANTSDSSAKR